MSFLFSGEHHDEECDRLPDGGNLLLGNWARTLCWEGKIVMMMMMMIYIYGNNGDDDGGDNGDFPRNTGATLFSGGEISF